MKKIFFLFSTLILCATSYAQFFGGPDDGSTRSKLIGSQLNGSIESFAVLYQGSSGDGFDKDHIQTILSAQPLTLYEGGRGDGFAVNRSTSTTTGVEFAILYSGSSGDGWARALETALLDGGSISEVFMGGSGDGFDRSLLVNVFLEGFIADLYDGGVGDGHSSQISADNFLSGMMVLIFNGGDGDGHSSKLSSANILSGLMLVLYGGGDGDGYAFNKFNTTLTLDVIEVLLEQDVIIFPNPASNLVTIKTGDGVIISSIALYDLAGKFIPVKLSENSTFSVDNLANGVYLLTIFSEEKGITKKLIVKK